MISKEECERLGLRITNIHDGLSLVVGANFYYTNEPSIIATDYDTVSQTKLNDTVRFICTTMLENKKSMQEFNLSHVELSFLTEEGFSVILKFIKDMGKNISNIKL